MTDSAPMRFPKGFLWGTATAGHQTEGNNTNSDWWDWETNKPLKNKWPVEPSGIACDSYNRYEEDFDLCKSMHNNAVRLSVEWARIEPRPGEFDAKEIAHYQRVLAAARKRGLKTFVTLHHYTSPLWFAKRGGWTRWDAPMYFARYTAVCVRKFASRTDFFLTINEPDGSAFMGYFVGRRYPGRHNLLAALMVNINYHRAHNAAYNSIKTYVKKPVGIVKNIGWFEAHPQHGTLVDRWLATFCLWLCCDLPFWFLRHHLDFIGYNYYFTVQFSRLIPHAPRGEVSDMGWSIYPQGLGNMLTYLKKYALPIYVTENGLADATDRKRKRFLHDHLAGMWRAIQKGTNVRGYLHWTLIDNFEWNYGFQPRFGLVEIDREDNLTRKPRPSFSYYASICKNNALPAQFHRLVR